MTPHLDNLIIKEFFMDTSSVSKYDYRFNFDLALNALQGRFVSTIFPALGVNVGKVKKGNPCPVCRDGRDRFTCDDKDGLGTWICRKCPSDSQAGNGVNLISLVHGVTYYEAMVMALGVVGFDITDFGASVPSSSVEIDHKALQERQERLSKEKQERDAVEKEEKERLQAEVIEHANSIYNTSSLFSHGSHPYLVSKRISVHQGVKQRHHFKSHQLVIPAYTVDSLQSLQLQTLQFISPKKEGGFGKIFMKDAPTRGAFHIVDCIVDDENASEVVQSMHNSEIILLAEGYATAVSIYEALDRKYKVIATFTAGNMIWCAKAIRSITPKARLIFCADNDKKTELNSKNGKNAGYEAGLASAHEVQGELILADIKDDLTLSDFNDIAVKYGLEEAKRQLEHGLNNPQPLPSIPTPSTSHSTGTRNAKKKEYKKFDEPETDDSDLEYMLNNYVFIQGTQDVFNKETMARQPIKTLMLEFPNTYKDWSYSRKRKKVKVQNVVFDPTETFVPEDKSDFFINTYKSDFPVIPTDEEYSSEAVETIIALVRHLCGKDNSDEVLDWVLNWLAIPLQNVGTKMDTALVVHGHVHGAGKSMLFSNIMRNIYGRFGAVLGQGELSGTYNDWADNKLFLSFEEVTQGREKYTLAGKIKHLITGMEIQIHKKYLSVYSQKNHFNVVFLSNDQKPISLELNDRRYVVLHPEEILPEELRQKLEYYLDKDESQIAIRSFYKYLLHKDVGSQNHRAKPIETKARNKLMDVSTPSWDSFILDWQNSKLQINNIDVPYIVCLSTDLYKAYTIWCREGGETATSQKSFITAVEKYGNEKKVKRYLVTYEWGGNNTTVKPVVQNKQATLIMTKTFKMVLQSSNNQGAEAKLLGDSITTFSRILKDVERSFNPFLASTDSTNSQEEKF